MRGPDAHFAPMLTARSLYTLLWHLALPALPLRLWWRGRREPGYREHVGERFGRYGPSPPAKRTFWVHAVSVGETRAAAPLVDCIRSAHPDARIVLTCMTATGRETGHALLGERVVQAYLPYDLPFAVDRFLGHFAPCAGILVETELWPNLAAACARRSIPLFLVSARMSERSANGYRRFPSITRPMLASLAGVAAQTTADADRLRTLGAADAAVTGNLKFDVAVPDAQRASGRAMRERFGASRPVFLAASTRDGEEAMLLDALARAPLPADVLTVVVPRHPQRFGAVATLLRERGLAFARRSDEGSVAAEVRFVLGDSMGEMLAYCEACDVAFVGGSLLPLGGQNVIEPIALGKPTLTGPHTFNFAQAVEQAATCGALRRVNDAPALVAEVRALLASPSERATMSRAASTFIAAHRGAADRTWRWIEGKLARRSADRAIPSGAG